MFSNTNHKLLLRNRKWKVACDSVETQLSLWATECSWYMRLYTLCSYAVICAVRKNYVAPVVFAKVGQYSRGVAENRWSSNWRASPSIFVTTNICRLRCFSAFAKHQGYEYLKDGALARVEGLSHQSAYLRGKIMGGRRWLRTAAEAMKMFRKQQLAPAKYN